MAQTDDQKIQDFLLLELYYVYALFQALLGKKLSDKSISGLAEDLIFPVDSANKNKESGDSTLDKTIPNANENFEEVRRIEQLRQSIVDRFGHQLPLRRLQQLLQYDEIQHLWIILALAPSIDPRFEELYRCVSHELSHHPLEPSFTPLLLGYEWQKRFDAIARSRPDNPLRELGILNFDTVSRKFWVSERVLHFASGNHYEPQILSPALSRSDYEICSESLKRWTNPLQEILKTSNNRAGILVALPDPSAAGIVNIASKSLGWKTVTIDLCKLYGLEDPLTIVDTWLREALLRFAVPVLDIGCIRSHTNSPLNDQILDYLCERLSRWPLRFILCTQQLTLPLPFESLDLMVFESSRFSADDRQSVWLGLFTDVVVDSASDNFDIAETQLKQVALAYDYDLPTTLRIGRRAVQKLKQYPGATVHEALSEACRHEAQRPMTQLGHYVETRFSLEDIVLPATTKEQLQELCEMAQFQNKIRNEWGLGSKLLTRPSITALFAGPSGTGKTMAAESIAAQLGRPLLQVDLAAIVSKYIGETEKNLEKVFTQAEASSSLLFFDEADALFGKRSEVKEAHDRYANIEISYLLQRMEQYKGMAILASNLRQHLDDAFVRRLTMTVLFPFPSWELRAKIWKQSIPKQLPLDESIDLNDIARRYNLSGGNIRNAVIAAAYQAAINDSVIDENCILHGIRRELQKMGKQMVKEETA
jgi:regulator of sigma D